MPDPEPLETVGALAGESAVVQANPHRVENSNLLEPEGRMTGIRFEEGKVFVGYCPDVIRKLPVVKPEVRVGEMVQSGVQRPAA